MPCLVDYAKELESKGQSDYLLLWRIRYGIITTTGTNIGVHTRCKLTVAKSFFFLPRVTRGSTKTDGLFDENVKFMNRNFNKA